MAARARAPRHASAARRVALAVMSIVLLATPAASALAQTPGPAMRTEDAHGWRLDPTFNGNGWAETLFTNGADDAAWASDMAIQPDGGIVVAGTLHYGRPSGAAGADFAVARYRPDGALDPSFGDHGRAIVSFGGFDEAFGVALEEVAGQTKIVVVGHVYLDAAPGHRFAIARLNADGSLDTDHDADPRIHFSHDGRRTVAFPGDRAFARGVTIDPDGGIVVAGRLDPAGFADEGDIGLIRLLPRTGGLDPDFGDGGRTALNVSDVDHVTSVVVQPAAHGDGFRLLVAGSVSGPKGSDLAVTRFLPSGRLDRTFGSEGTVRTPMRDPDVIRSYESIEGLAIDAQRRIVAVGSWRVIIDHEQGYVSDIPAVVRYTPDGALDTAFGGGGIVRIGETTRGSYYRVGTDIAVRPSGRVVWAGSRNYAAGGDRTNVLVGGLEPDGSPDLRFGEAGVRTISIGPAGDAAYALALDHHGRIVVAATSEVADPNSVGAGFGICRLALQ